MIDIISSQIILLLVLPNNQQILPIIMHAMAPAVIEGSVSEKRSKLSRPRWQSQELQLRCEKGARRYKQIFKGAEVSIC